MRELPPPTVVAFDLGGVLCRINRTWGNACRQAGISALIDDLPLAACPGFEAYQRGDATIAEYLPMLQAFLGGVSRDEAIAVHQAILVGPYEGTLQLVESIREAGIQVGVLSNTNALHWDVLINPAVFPAIAAAGIKCASHLVGLEKPDAAIYEFFCREAGCSPEQILFFDDHDENVSGAIACSWQACLVDPFGDPAKQIRGILARLGILLD